MVAFILRRLAYGILVLFGVLTLVFFIFNILPGDPTRMMLGQRADQEAIEEINRELGLDRSLMVQYAIYLNDLSPFSIHHTDERSATFYREDQLGGWELVQLGNYRLVVKAPYLRRSYQSQRKVSDILLGSLPETAILAISAILIAGFFGILLGILSALFQDRFLDRLLLVLATLGMALPSFFTGVIVAWLFGFVWSEFTGLKMSGSLYEVDDLGRGEYLNLSNLILPAFTLGIRPLAVILQLSRNAFIEVFSQDYVRTAKAKGLKFKQVILKHVMKNALNPVLTAISGMFAGLMAGAVFVEIIFSWKGIGWEIVNALEKYDLPIVMGAVLIIAVIFVSINILVDILYGFLDPRARV